MRPILWLLLLFALAVAITLTAQFDSGYVLVVVPPWRLEMSFILAALAMLLIFTVGYFIARLVKLALSLPNDVRAWRGRRRSDKAADDLSRAIAAYLSGQHGHARKLAAAVFKHERRPMAALLAAHAALAEGDEKAARTFLDSLQTDVGELTAARQALEARLTDGGGKVS